MQHKPIALHEAFYVVALMWDQQSNVWLGHGNTSGADHYQHCGSKGVNVKICGRVPGFL